MSDLKKFSTLFLILAFLPGFGSGERLFAPSADLWERWAAHDPNSAEKIDHTAWTRLLAKHVGRGPAGVNLVDYRAFSTADRAALDDYIDGLAALAISRFSRDEQLAFWINLYNALTVQVVLDHFPVESIRDIDISPGLFAIGPWGKTLIEIDGEELSLNDIEHRILRPIWRDPRVHYALNCASIGCPNLRERSYTGSDIDAELQAAAAAYVNDARGVSIADGKVTVSRIYDWFIEDFGDDAQGVLKHLRAYAAPALAAELQAIGRLHDTAYDWSLNAAR